MNKILLSVFLSVSFNLSAQRVFNILNYGAKGDGISDDAKAIQRTLDQCSKAGGGTVLVPGTHVFISGPIELRSNIRLRLEPGAILKAIGSEKFYVTSAFGANKGEGTTWIRGNNLTNVTIEGSGSIDGNSIKFMGKELQDSYVLKPFKVVDRRPHVLTLIGCKNVRIHDIHIGNSAYWTIHLAGCDDVVISGITLVNNLKVRNGDGIDIDHSKHVRISDCHIESGDDCICLKNRREYREFGKCEDIIVSDCTLTSRSCAIKIGSENMDTISNVVFNGCIISDSNRGIGIQNRDEGTVTDVVFSNIIVKCHLFSDVWWGKAEPIYVTAFRRASIDNKDAKWRFPNGATEGKVGQIYNIYFSNIKCESENGIYVSAESADKIQKIYFDQIDIKIEKTTSFPGGVYDRRPCLGPAFESGNTSGFFLENATGITIRNSSISWGVSKPPYYKYGIDIEHVKGLKVIGFEGSSAFPDKYPSIKNEK